MDKQLSEFLSETESYIEQLDTLSFDSAADLYDLFDEAADTATMHISEIDPELRVKITDRQDEILERIVDVIPPFEHSGERLGVYAPSLYNYKQWDNVELMKDCGLVPFFLAKILNAKPVMFYGSKPSDYPYLVDLPGLEMLYHDSEHDPEEAYKNFLINNFHKIDVLVFYGMYNQMLGYLDVYRKLRSDGKVYCGLDMNLWWMDNIQWNSEPGRQFAKQCDIVATSCRLVRDSMNRNPDVPFPCRWLPNGFYNPKNEPVTADVSKKENIILTVGRIGTEQKNNEELLLAFTLVSDELSNWELHLVGPIEPGFQPFISNFYSIFPNLQERVIFTGSITDKTALYKKYASAKVFALTSTDEGGTPNVYAEALFHGCMFVTSDISGADDITNYGELGEKYPLGNIEALKDALIKVCSGADKKSMREHIKKALKYAARYYDWNRNAKKLAYMLFK